MLNFLANATPSAAEGGPLDKFGVDYKMIIAQVIIFLLVYTVLSKFAFGPVNAILEARRNRIAEGEENLKKIKHDLESANVNAAEIRTKADAEATRMIKEASDAAVAVGEAKRQQAISEAAAIVAKAREATTLERERVLGELKSEFGRLVIDTTSKVSGKVLNQEDHDRISKEALAQISL